LPYISISWFRKGARPAVQDGVPCLAGLAAAARSCTRVYTQDTKKPELGVGKEPA